MKSLMKKLAYIITILLMFDSWCFALPTIITCYNPQTGERYYSGYNCDYQDTHIPNLTNCQRMDMHELLTCSPYVNKQKSSIPKSKN